MTESSSVQPFITACPHCRGEVQATQEHIGYEAQCPFCESTFIVQAPDHADPSRTATASASETSEISQDETMSMPPSGPDDDSPPVTHIPPAQAPAPTDPPPGPPDDHSVLSLCCHALHHNYPAHLAAAVELNTAAAWQYAAVAEIIDAAIVDAVQTVRETQVAQITTWMFNKPKALKQIADRLSAYLDVLSRTQAMLQPNLPDPPWRHDGDFYRDFHLQLSVLAAEMARVHAAICQDPLPIKEPFDEIQRLMLCWTVDYMRNLHTLAERFREKAELPHSQTAIGTIQFTLSSPSFSRFIDLYNAVR